LLKHPFVKVNMPNNKGCTPFFSAFQKGHKEVVALLLADMRIKINKRSNEGCTPFFVASQNDHREVVSLLVEDPGIDVNKPDYDRCTPLWLASQNGRLEVVRLILASATKIDTKTKSLAPLLGTTRPLLRLLAVKRPESSLKGNQMRSTSGGSRMAL